MYRDFFKRLVDIIATIILIVFLSPMILLLALIVRIGIGSPILFKQCRPGKDEKPFNLYKFRTMRAAYDANGEPLSDEKRLTKFGRLLRSLSLDELPELFNVLKGEMSLVGPRPLLMDYLPYYSHEERLRHKVRPGITGWAQVNGRNRVTWEKKFALDVWYVKHCSFLLDCKIIILTFVKIVKREGISALGEATMTRFDEEAKNKLRAP